MTSPLDHRVPPDCAPCPVAPLLVESPRCDSTEPFAVCGIMSLPCSVAVHCPVQGRSPSYGLQPFFRNPRTRDISQLYHPLEWFHLRVFKTFLVWSTVPLSLYFKHTWSVTDMRSAIPSPILFACHTLDKIEIKRTLILKNFFVKLLFVLICGVIIE